MSGRYETLVVGSGPAGMAAAVCAAVKGRRVGLIDDNPRTGGQIWRASGKPEPSRGLAANWRRRLFSSSVTLLQGWSVFDQPASNTLRAERQGQSADFKYDQLILATGARERLLPFPGWTLPNVMGVGATQAMVKGGMPIKGKQVVIAGSGPLLLAVAASLKAAGAKVLCVCEQAGLSQLLPFALSLAVTPGKIVEGLRYKGSTWTIPYHFSSWVVEGAGDTRLRSVTLFIQGKRRTVDCDYLACAFHLVPNLELPMLLGCRIENGSVAVGAFQETSQSGIYCAGEPTGIGGLDLALVEGQIAGMAAAGLEGQARHLFAKRERLRRFAHRLSLAFALRPELKSLPQPDTLLCRCEDVPFGRVREHHSWRSAKLHTRCGMGPCQGRICGSATEFLLGWNADSTRPPAFPTRIESLARLADQDEIYEAQLR